jgi:NADH:ubiquinone oxidoreductase subunit C
VIPTIFTLFTKFFFFSFKTLSEIAVIDYPNKKCRFKINYLILSYFYNFRLTLSCFISERISLSSLTLVYLSASWLEREVFDLFGIYFSQNNDLRRILTDYGFFGFPLRKDFPLSGFYEVFFNDLTAQVTYQKISLAQEFRDFSHQNPWKS